MRISDWSSDVCSSDLGTLGGVTGGLAADVAVVLAQENGAPALALVDLSGIERIPVQSFENSRYIADLRFDRAPAELLIAGEAAYEAALHILALHDRKSKRLNSSHTCSSRMPSSA